MKGELCIGVRGHYHMTCTFAVVFSSLVLLIIAVKIKKLVHEEKIYSN